MYWRVKTAKRRIAVVSKSLNIQSQWHTPLDEIPHQLEDSLIDTQGSRQDERRRQLYRCFIQHSQTIEPVATLLFLDTRHTQPPDEDTYGRSCHIQRIHSSSRRLGRYEAQHPRFPGQPGTIVQPTKPVVQVLLLYKSLVVRPTAIRPRFNEQRLGI